MMKSELKPTVVYVRVSTAGQNYASQEDQVKQYCQARGWPESDLSIVREKISGAAKTRPALDAIIGAARQGKVRRVVVFKMDRLGRSAAHLCWVLSEFERMKVTLICTNQGIDTSDDSPTGKIFRILLAAFAEMESDMIRERIKAGVAAARRRGSKLGRPATDPAHAEKAAALRRKGKTYFQIGQALGISETTAYRLSKDVPGPKPVRSIRRGGKPSKRAVSKSSPQNQGVLALA